MFYLHLRLFKKILMCHNTCRLFFYIELKKFKKQFDELSTALDRWVTFLTRAHELNKNNIPEALSKDKAISKAIYAVDRMFDEEERSIYETRMEAIANIESRIASANEKGIEQGIEQERGKSKKEKYQMIMNMDKAGSTIDFISQVTGFSVEDAKCQATCRILLLFTPWGLCPQTPRIFLQR